MIKNKYVLAPESLIALLDENINEHEISLTKLRSEREMVKATQQLPCGHCGAIHQISELQYVQIIYYEAPHGCTGGDYCYNSDSSEFICPACNFHNMLRFRSSYDIPYDERNKYKNDPAQQFQREYKLLFKNVVDIHDKERRGYWGGISYERVCNDYVDEHHKDFGLRIEYGKNMASK